MKGLRFLLPLFSSLRGRLFVAILLSLVAMLAGVGLLGLSGWFITATGLSTAGALFNIMAPSAGVRGFSFLRIIARYGERLSGHGATLSLLARTRVFVFRRLLQQVPFNTAVARGDLVSRLVADLDALDNIVLLALGPITTAALIGLLMTGGLALLLPAAALPFGLAYLAAALLVPLALVRLSRPIAREAVEATSQLRARLLEGMDGHADLVVFDGLGRLTAMTDQAIAQLAAARRRLGRLAAFASFSVQALAALALVATLAMGLVALSAQAIDGPVLVGILLAVLGSFEATALLVRSSSRLSASLAAADRVMALVGPGGVSEAPVSASPPDVVIASAPGLSVRGLAFAYPGGRPVLSGVSFDLPYGQRMAITGPSGSGKSTLAALLVRLMAPTGGEICLAGQSAPEMDSARLRRHFAVMTQDAPVFADSVRANLLMGNPAADDEALWRVLRDVDLEPAIRALPRGLDAVVGEAGRSLSVGQSRRLALARTLLSPAPILILDEPTSGLDRRAALAFLAALPRLTAGRSLLVITHERDLAGFDQVFDLRGGRLVPAG